MHTLTIKAYFIYPDKSTPDLFIMMNYSEMVCHLAVDTVISWHNKALQGQPGSYN